MDSMQQPVRRFKSSCTECQRRKQKVGGIQLFFSPLACCGSTDVYSLLSSVIGFIHACTARIAQRNGNVGSSRNRLPKRAIRPKSRLQQHLRQPPKLQQKAGELARKDATTAVMIPTLTVIPSLTWTWTAGKDPSDRRTPA
jgi:hypothetical protein